MSLSATKSVLSGTRRKRVMIAVVVVSVMLGASIAIDQTFAIAGRGTGSLSGPSSGGANALDIFARRSPGERLAAELAKGKARVQAALGGDAEPSTVSQSGPVERALGKIFTPEDLGGSVIDATPDPSGQANAGSLPGVFAAAAPNPANAGRIGPLPGGFAGGTIIPPGAGTSPSGVSTDVPEPATWFMMVFGIALAGIALRRQRRRDFGMWAS